jgi:hypothetical protein
VMPKPIGGAASRVTQLDRRSTISGGDRGGAQFLPRMIVRTDSATLAIFDPEVVGPCRLSEGDCWCRDLSQTPEFRSGRLAIVSLSGDGIYAVRVAFNVLTPRGGGVCV